MSPRLSMPTRLPLSRALTVALALGCGLLAAPSEARDLNGGQPAVRVAPDLAAEWILQLSPGSGVVPGYQRPNLARTAPNYSGVSYGARAPAQDGRRPVYGTAQRAMPAARTDAGYTGSVTRQAAVAPAREMKRVDSIDPMFLPQVVDYATGQKPGTVVIDTSSKFLYLVEADGKARRYGVGVGKPGFAWAGTHRVTQKKEWPAWTPPAQMREREKKKGKILPVRMDGGPLNPLGARAMYLGSTLYRIHGTNQPWSIGKAVSSGCIRMRNEDVSDLYERVGVGTRVIVL